MFISIGTDRERFPDVIARGIIKGEIQTQSKGRLGKSKNISSLFMVHYLLRSLFKFGSLMTIYIPIYHYYTIKLLHNFPLIIVGTLADTINRKSTMYHISFRTHSLKKWSTEIQCYMLMEAFKMLFYSISFSEHTAYLLCICKSINASLCMR